MPTQKGEIVISTPETLLNFNCTVSDHTLTYTSACEIIADGKKDWIVVGPTVSCEVLLCKMNRPTCIDGTVTQ